MFVGYDYVVRDVEYNIGDEKDKIRILKSSKVWLR